MATLHQERRFVITELRAVATRRLDGSVVRGFTETPTQFVWDADTLTAPRDVWEFGKQLRSVKEHYPGAEAPTEQILGSHFKDFTINGEWDDRYAGDGFAEAQRIALEALIDRGSMLRIQFEALSIDAILTEVTIRYKRGPLQGYALTFSAHYRTPDGTRPAADTNSARSPDEFARPINDAHDALAALTAGLPAPAMTNTTWADISAGLTDVNVSVNEMQTVIAQRVTIAGAGVSAVGRFKATFENVRRTSKAFADLLRGMRTDVQLDHEDAIKALSFEAQREAAAQARDAAVLAAAATAEMSRRADPDAKTLYRPRKGESLYGISNRFYGTAKHWRAIADRNNLSTLTLQGSELLVIPSLR